MFWPISLCVYCVCGSHRLPNFDGAHFLYRYLLAAPFPTHFFVLFCELCRCRLCSFIYFYSSSWATFFGYVLHTHFAHSYSHSHSRISYIIYFVHILRTVVGCRRLCRWCCCYFPELRNVYQRRVERSANKGMGSQGNTNEWIDGWRRGDGGSFNNT